MTSELLQTIYLPEPQAFNMFVYLPKWTDSPQTLSLLSTTWSLNQEIKKPADNLKWDGKLLHYIEAPTGNKISTAKEINTQDLVLLNSKVALGIISHSNILYNVYYDFKAR